MAPKKPNTRHCYRPIGDLLKMMTTMQSTLANTRVERRKKGRPTAAAHEMQLHKPKFTWTVPPLHIKQQASRVADNLCKLLLSLACVSVAAEGPGCCVTRTFLVNRYMASGDMPADRLIALSKHHFPIQE